MTASREIDTESAQKGGLASRPSLLLIGAGVAGLMERCSFSNLYSQAVNKSCDARCGRLVFMELFVLKQLRAACASLYSFLKSQLLNRSQAISAPGDFLGLILKGGGLKKLRMPSRCRGRGPGWKRCPESAVLGSEFCRAHLPTKSSGSRDSSAGSLARYLNSQSS